MLVNLNQQETRGAKTDWKWPEQDIGARVQSIEALGESRAGGMIVCRVRRMHVHASRRVGGLGGVVRPSPKFLPSHPPPFLSTPTHFSSHLLHREPLYFPSHPPANSLPGKERH